jgi:hypothetical protein
MSYLVQAEIADNWSMRNRVAQAAASENAPGDPDEWTIANRRDWANAPGWSESWESAKVSHAETVGYDPGADEAVITDGMILSQVQSMVNAE